MRICQYKYCDNDISMHSKQSRYCCNWCKEKQHHLNLKELFIYESKNSNGYNNLKIPTRITPQADRYQDLLRYSTTVMSNFE